MGRMFGTLFSILLEYTHEVASLSRFQSGNLDLVGLCEWWIRL
jgi:hypothetical protein